jgi:TetR/AcrR family transcriptional repressor of bet genes
MTVVLNNPKGKVTVKMRAGGADQSSGDGEKRGRKASKETRRQQLIEATIDSLARRGYSETTMADVADGAGLSRGIVNFHFESKENLLIATLQFMSEEYGDHWNSALEKAGPSVASRLWAIVHADFDRKICTKRKLAAWCAFWGEAKSRPTYQALCGARDVKYQETVIALCADLKAEGDYDYEPEPMALSLCAMLEGLWLRLMMGDGTTREKALEAAIAFVVVAFPKNHTLHGPKPQ